jgi:hypothetical protein
MESMNISPTISPLTMRAPSPELQNPHEEIYALYLITAIQILTRKIDTIFPLKTNNHRSWTILQKIAITEKMMDLLNKLTRLL